jgi:hypothetical protein
MIRKLVSAGVLVLALAAANSKPALAAFPCECEECGFRPTARCLLPGGWGILCSDYTALYCPAQQDQG